MTKVGKKRALVDPKVNREKLYSLDEAVALVKEVNTTKFDASVDIHARLGVDPRKPDQSLRGTVSLPHGTGKTKKVAVFVPRIKCRKRLMQGLIMQVLRILSKK